MGGGGAPKDCGEEISFGSAELTHLVIGLLWREKWPEAYSSSFLICGFILAFSVMKNSRNKQVISFELHTIVSSMMKSHHVS